MIELLSVIAITAVLVVIITAAIGNYIEFARQTQLKHTVAVLNESLNEYRTLGGMSKAHSLQGEVGTTRNAQTFTDAVITAMKGGFTCGASLKKFINKTQNIDTTVIGSTGQGANFRFVLNTDTTETTPGDGGESTQDPTIIAGPYGYTSYAGYPTKLWVEVDGTEPFSAQWYFNDGSGYVPLGPTTIAPVQFIRTTTSGIANTISMRRKKIISGLLLVVSNSVGVPRVRSVHFQSERIHLSIASGGNTMAHPPMPTPLPFLPVNL
jgi:Tfp pilus assembly protein PilE